MILIRACKGQDELEACVQMQVDTWGYDPSDVIPRKAFLVWQKVGGQVLGAFDTEIAGASAEGGPESLVGFLCALPGIKTGPDGPRPFLHSHMMAVHEAHRNRGVGAQLKLAQRDEALARGIRHIEWTFDPLEIKNAYLNIHKLGAVVRSYLVDFYGVSSSRLQGGLPTDRLVAEWEIDSEHVRVVLARAPGETDRGALPSIIEEIVVPAPIDAWKAGESGREQALAVQRVNRARFQNAFSQRLAVIGFERDAEGNGVYQLGHLSELQLTSGLKLD